VLFRQIIHEDLGCASYLVGDTASGVAAGLPGEDAAAGQPTAQLQPMQDDLQPVTPQAVVTHFPVEGSASLPTPLQAHSPVSAAASALASGD